MCPGATKSIRSVRIEAGVKFAVIPILGNRWNECLHRVPAFGKKQAILGPVRKEGYIPRNAKNRPSTRMQGRWKCGFLGPRVDSFSSSCVFGVERTSITRLGDLVTTVGQLSRHGRVFQRSIGNRVKVNQGGKMESLIRSMHPQNGGAATMRGAAPVFFPLTCAQQKVAMPRSSFMRGTTR